MATLTHIYLPLHSYCPLLMTHCPAPLLLLPPAFVPRQVSAAMATYNIASLLSEYRAGTRQWMYDEVDAWLRGSSSTGHDQPAGGSSVACGDAAPSRLFVLLAMAGMGKSVFSAAIHTKLLALTNKDSNIIMVSLGPEALNPGLLHT